MRAMILAAGRGERMRPLTDHMPKPLVPAAGKALIAWNIEKLVKAGIRDIIINHAWLGEQLQAHLGCGARWGAKLSYSPESTALETAGGIAQALPFFQGAPFLVINGDIWTDWDASHAHTMASQMQAQDLAHLLLVPNPSHHTTGDFGVIPGSHYLAPMHAQDAQAYTLSGIGVYRPAMFHDISPGQRAKSAPLLHQGIAQSRVLGTVYKGYWIDVGTPERLQCLNEHLEARHRSR